MVGAPEPQRVGVGDVVGGHLLGQAGTGHPGGAGGVVDLVVDVGDVHDQPRRQALVLEEALVEAEHHVRARIPDVDAPVDGRTAGVYANFAVGRLQRTQAPGSRVMEPNLRHRRPK